MLSPNFIILSLLMSFVTGLVNEESPSLAATLAAKRGQRRVILVYAHDRTNPNLLVQQQLLTNQRKGLDERDFDQITVIGTELSADDKRYLRGGDRKLTDKATFMTYLIGKDGGVKGSFSAPVAPQTLFRLVDSMPMRQSEMRQKKE